jgi:hypothetical protein
VRIFESLPYLCRWQRTSASVTAVTAVSCCNGIRNVGPQQLMYHGYTFRVSVSGIINLEVAAPSCSVSSLHAGSDALLLMLQLLVFTVGTSPNLQSDPYLWGHSIILHSKLLKYKLYPRWMCGDCLCGLVVRVPNYIFRGSSFDSRYYQIFREVVCLKHGALTLMRIIEHLLWRNSNGSQFSKPRLTAVWTRCADHATPSIRKSRHQFGRSLADL